MKLAPAIREPGLENIDVNTTGGGQNVATRDPARADIDILLRDSPIGGEEPSFEVILDDIYNVVELEKFLDEGLYYDGKMYTMESMRLFAKKHREVRDFLRIVDKIVEMIRDAAFHHANRAATLVWARVMNHQYDGDQKALVKEIVDALQALSNSVTREELVASIRGSN